MGQDNPFKLSRPIAAKTLEEAVKAVLSDGQILSKQLNQEQTKGLVRCRRDGGFLAEEWYIMCLHKEKTQWVLKSARRTKVS